MLTRTIGSTFEVLVEGRAGGPIDGRVAWSGYTPNYLRVELQGGAGEALDNRILPVQATDVSVSGERLIVERF